VALVGSSGSGKSSIVGLVQRFYDVTQGRILIDGIDVKEFDNDWLH
jgi:ABC-type multidrug transport system fused ATPase/permease subunit